jgi:hypothetical protein
MAAGLAVTNAPDACAGSRPTLKQSNNASANAASQAKHGYERKCVTMSCGTPWCYSVRR